jgi:cold shock CspA family protein
LGWIKTIKENANYGFIRTEKGQEVFFHRADFDGFWDDLVSDFNDPNFGRIVMEFEPKDSPKGPRASKVRRLDNGIG